MDVTKSIVAGKYCLTSEESSAIQRIEREIGGLKMDLLVAQENLTTGNLSEKEKFDIRTNICHLEQEIEALRKGLKKYDDTQKSLLTQLKQDIFDSLGVLDYSHANAVWSRSMQLLIKANNLTVMNQTRQVEYLLTAV